MSNEELAIRVKNGDADAKLLLWNAVERFIVIMATRYTIAHQYAAEIDDLIQSGFIAMCKAAEAFDPERGTAFLTVFGYYLKKAFAEASGTRTSKRDSLLYCDSLDRPAYEGQEDSEPLSEYIEDDTAENAFADIENRDFLRYTQSVIAAALGTLEPVQQVLLVEKYLNNKSWKRCAETLNAEKNSLYDMGQRALYKLSIGKYGKSLRECLDGFNEYNNYKQAAQNSGLGGFNRFGVSYIEASAILSMGGYENG